MAALALHDRLFTPRFEQVRASWLERALELTEPATQLFPHRVYPETGALADGSRATSQVIVQRFLPWVDPELARAQYRTFRELFVTTRFGLPAVQEYPAGAEGPGDVDSGPLLFGVSASSSVVSIGAALLHGDRALAEPLVTAGEFLGFPYHYDGKKTYAFGLLPVSDAFLLWSKLAYAEAPPDFVGAGEAEPFPPVVTPSWRRALHVVSALFVLPLLLGPLLRYLRKRRLERELAG
jgi:hypothetical protein